MYLVCFLHSARKQQAFLSVFSSVFRDKNTLKMICRHQLNSWGYIISQQALSISDGESLLAYLGQNMPKKTVFLFPHWYSI